MPASDYAVLALETGDTFFGFAFGAEASGAGEVVFNTSMTGYQEISTDASYRGQIVVMTYPLIDNYGVNPDDVESRRPWIAGLAVRELAPTHSNWRQQSDMNTFLARHGIPGIQGIDTRALTRTLRTKGHQRGVLRRAPADVTEGLDPFAWIRGQAPAAAAWAAAQVKAARRVLPTASSAMWPRSPLQTAMWQARCAGPPGPHRRNAWANPELRCWTLA